MSYSIYQTTLKFEKIIDKVDKIIQKLFLYYENRHHEIYQLSVCLTTSWQSANVNNCSWSVQASDNQLDYYVTLIIHVAKEG